MKTNYLILTIALTMIAGSLLAQQAGDLDNSFGAGGTVTTDIVTPPAGDVIKGLAMQADGKIVAVGYSYIISSTVSLVLARYHANGTLDSIFGTNGIIIRDTINDFDGWNPGCSVVLQSDGKIVVSGITSSLTLLRYNSDGSPDTSFGLNGEVVNDSLYHVTSVRIQTDGKIVAFGIKLFPAFGRYFFALARYHTDGTLDTGFGTGGLATIDLQDSPVAGSMVIQPDGKIIAGGHAGDQFYDYALAQFHADGNLDTAFGANGKVISDFGAGSDKLYSLALQPDGKIVAAGVRTARYNSNGSIDSTFGTNGIVSNSALYQVYSGALQPDGKIVVAGYAQDATGSSFALTRYKIDGSLDNDFGTGGALITDVGLGGGDIATAIII